MTATGILAAKVLCSLVGNYRKRDARAANTRESFRALMAAADPAPPVYGCSVCGIEKALGVPMWVLSTPTSHTFYCSDHIPEEWRPTPAQIEQARQRA